MKNPQEMPESFYSTIHAWIYAGKDAKEHKKRAKNVYAQEPMNGKEPKGIEKNSYLAYFAQSSVSPEDFIAMIENGRIAIEKDRHAVLAPDGRLIWDISRRWEKQAADHWVFAKGIAARPTVTSESVAVVLSRPWQDYYYHWMFNILPGFRLLSKASLPIDKYIIPPCSTSFQLESLRLLGIPKEKWIEARSPLHLRPNRLLVPYFLNNHGVVPTWVCRYLNRLFNPLSRSRTGFERVYISREKAKRRRVTNEDQVLRLLGKYGFKKITLESLPVSEQAELFHSAKFIVAPHGAGLVNLVFCKPGAKVIEFFNPYYVNAHYCIISNRCQLDYYFLIGEGERPLEQYYFAGQNGGTYDIAVDLRKLKKTLEMAGMQ